MIIIGALFVLAVAFMYRASGCYIDLSSIPGFGSSGEQKNENLGKLTNIHFLDVGQGDSILICGSDKNILIDGGERDKGEGVLADIKELGVKKLDYIIATHPHSDHIGGLIAVLRYAADYDDLDIEEIIMPDVPEENIPTSSTYGYFLEGIEKNDLSVTFAEYGMTIDIGSGVMTIYPPVEGKTYESLNDYSVCAYLECGETSFFFTGDMEKQEEKDMMEEGYLKGVKASVLKAGHHGSGTSSSDKFLRQLDPEYVVISCGSGNQYGHPHENALKRFRKYTDEIYRTDLEGRITCTTDGETIAWTVKGN